jgi:SpoVK/Ycf46/Vps4 family AAA+-type ATPase
MLPLSSPDEFTYGVLRSNKIHGALLYGAPGTGKTHLARALAKESGASMLEVSGAEIMQKYVGESERSIKAIFSVARKLHPCFIFIDEADAIFRARQDEESNYRREMLNQFLKEWDGVNSHDAFILVATNRPWELDKAAMRRLPTRIMVGLPAAEDRLEILKIYLKEEHLAADVDINAVAARTPNFTGSDLKNLCVAAALACVYEVMESRKQNRRILSATSRGKLPEGSKVRTAQKRILHMRHFEAAMREVSTSTDPRLMSQLRGFDEQFGGSQKGEKSKKIEEKEEKSRPTKPKESTSKTSKKTWPQHEALAYYEGPTYDLERTRLPTELDTVV